MIAAGITQCYTFFLIFPHGSSLYQECPVISKAPKDNMKLSLAVKFRSFAITIYLMIPVPGKMSRGTIPA
jgi:hypothetical protein